MQLKIQQRKGRASRFTRVPNNYPKSNPLGIGLTVSAQVASSYDKLLLNEIPIYNKGEEVKKMKKILSYVGFGIALMSQVASLFGFIPVTMATVISGLFGFSGAIAFRSWLGVESKFKKSYIVGGAGILSCLLYCLNVIPYEFVVKAMEFFAVTFGVTITQTIAKAKNLNGGLV